MGDVIGIAEYACNAQHKAISLTTHITGIDFQLGSPFYLQLITLCEMKSDFTLIFWINFEFIKCNEYLVMHVSNL